MDYHMPIRHTVVVSEAAATKAADAAVSVLERLRFDPNRYEASVGACHGTYGVAFVERGAKSGQALGNPGRIPGVEVSVSGDTFKVLDFGLIR